MRGVMVADRTTVPVKPFSGFSVIVKVAKVPRETVWEEGEAKMEKSGGPETVTDTVTE